MKRPKGIAYGPIITWSVVLVLASAACGWILARRLYPFMLLDLPVMALAIARILHHYGDSVRRVTFMFNAIDSDDLTFRFNEDPSTVDNTMLNTALNRIKEILARTKLQAEERERYYQLIMESAQTGLITVNDTGSVYQPTARRCASSACSASPTSGSSSSRPPKRRGRWPPSAPARSCASRTRPRRAR